LYAADGDTWGGFDPSTGRISLSRELVFRHLKGSAQTTAPADQAQALATVLHEVTHAQMETDAPDEPNAVRFQHSLGMMEGFAEVRALRDFRAFARLTGYRGLDLPKPQYPAAFGAAEDLLKQASGPRKTFTELIAEGTRGPAVMHFDQLADGVLRNRLHDVVPGREADRLAVRAALIETMLHPAWPDLKNAKGISTGQAVARDIRSVLDAKVDEIRRHYRATPDRVFPAEGMNAGVVRVAESNKLAGLPPPVASDRVERAAPGGETPLPSARASDAGDGREPGGVAEPAVQDAGGRPREQDSNRGPAAQEPGSGLEERRSDDGRDSNGGSGERATGGGAGRQEPGNAVVAPGAGGAGQLRGANSGPSVRGTDSGTQVWGAEGGPRGRGPDGGAGGQGSGEGTKRREAIGGAAGRGAAGGVEMRFLEGQASAAGAED
jgi:hypothetical protein